MNILELTLLGCFGLGFTLMNTSNCSINWLIRPEKYYIFHLKMIKIVYVTSGVVIHKTNITKVIWMFSKMI